MGFKSDIEIAQEAVVQDIREIAKKLNLPVYKSFLKEFFKLNWETRLHYLEKTSCLLDRTNLEFARIIDENYKDSFPNNSTWWGFD